MLKGIDLFAGAGGLSEGFMQAGFEIIGTVEKDKWACETQRTRHIYHYLKQINCLNDYWEYCKNLTTHNDIENYRDVIFKKHPYLIKYIEETVLHAEFGNSTKNGNTSSFSEIIASLEKSANSHNTNIDFILGGPPCQAYSIIGRSRMGNAVQDDVRNYLFEYYCDVVKHFQPKLFLFENVSGILTAKNGSIFKAIQERFESINYDFISGVDEETSKNIQIASSFGVPQNRKRFIFLGIRKDINIKYPKFTKESNHEELNTRNVIGDLPFLFAGEGQDHGIVKYSTNNKISTFQKEMRLDSKGIMNHKARPVNKSYDREIYRLAINKAENNEHFHYSDSPEELRKHKNQKHFKDRFKVHWNGKVPHTIVAHIAKDGHYNIHPDIKQLRSLTVREAARIQSFPDDFKFEGPRTSQYIQVGNAVPPKMANAYAVNIASQVSDIE